MSLAFLDASGKLLVDPFARQLNGIPLPLTALSGFFVRLPILIPIVFITARNIALRPPCEYSFVVLLQRVAVRARVYSVEVALRCFCHSAKGKAVAEGA